MPRKRLTDRDFWIIADGKGGILARDDDAGVHDAKQTPWLFASERGAKRYITESGEKVVKARLEVVTCDE